MKTAFAKETESSVFEDLGRATVQIVHDLKNQLNGLKLYATFLRKRLERDDRATEERETLAKLIAGLDRAARDMTALVRYTQPLELRFQPHIDLRKIITDTGREIAAQHGRGDELFCCQIEPATFTGNFDPVALSQAMKALTEQAVGGGSLKDPMSLQLRRVNEQASQEALIEWRGLPAANSPQSLQSFQGYGTVHAALAARIIQAHGGRVEFAANTIRVWLPLTA